MKSKPEKGEGGSNLFSTNPGGDPSPSKGPGPLHRWLTRRALLKLLKSGHVERRVNEDGKEEWKLTEKGRWMDP